MSEAATSQDAPFQLEHCLMSEADLLPLLEGRRARSGGRVMDAKAQVVAEFTRSIRVPGHFPPLPELRQQLLTMVQLLDEPAPAIARIEDLALPGPAGDIPARLYADSADAGLPVLAYLHGGGFVQGDLDTHHGLCARLAQMSGAMVVAIDYRLAPEHKFPAGAEDCWAAYAWLRANAATLGGDPARVAVGGDSAGGNLSVVVSQRAVREGVRPPEFQVLIYPVVDLHTDTGSHAEFAEGAVIPRDRIDWYMQQYLNGPADLDDPVASPLFAGDLAGQPPALIVSGGFDPLRDDAVNYAEKLRQAGVHVTLHEYPGQIHAFVSLTKAIPEGMAATVEIADFMRRQFAL